MCTKAEKKRAGTAVPDTPVSNTRVHNNGVCTRNRRETSGHGRTSRPNNKHSRTNNNDVCSIGRENCRENLRAQPYLWARENRAGQTQEPRILRTAATDEAAPWPRSSESAASNARVHNGVCTQFVEKLTGTVAPGYYMSAVYSQTATTDESHPWPDLFDFVHQRALRYRIPGTRNLVRMLFGSARWSTTAKGGSYEPNGLHVKAILVQCYWYNKNSCMKINCKYEIIQQISTRVILRASGECVSVICRAGPCPPGPAAPTP